MKKTYLIGNFYYAMDEHNVTSCIRRVVMTKKNIFNGSSGYISYSIFSWLWG